MKKHAPYTKLKRTLAADGITYKDVARVIQTTEATVMCKINGSSDFYLSEMVTICSAFNIDFNLFFEAAVA